MPFGHDARVELRHLRYFVALAELANFTKAAQRLRVAQPALSRQMRDLEDELGVALLARDSRGTKLTAAGEAFAAEARAVLLRADEATRVARSFAEGERGELHIGYAPSPTVELLPRILHAFQGEAPGVQMKLHDLSSEEMLRGLREGRLDVALLVRPLAKDLRGLIFEELCRYPVCVALANDHPLVRAKRVPLSAVAGEPLLAFAQRDYPEYHEWLDALFAPLGARPRIIEEHDSATSLIASAEARRGIAFVLSCFACLAGPRLKLREIQPAPEPFAVGVACAKRELSPVAKKFVALLRTLPKPKRN
jgi:DNA-binding transcriptional LysR family regulator